MAVQLIVPGRREETRADSDLQSLAQFDLQVETQHVVQIEAAARGRAEEVQLDDLDDSDVVELIYEEDLREWVRMDELRKRLTQSQGPRSAAPAVRLPSTLTMATTRGGIDLALTGLRLLKVSLGDVLGNLLKDKLVDVGAGLVSRAGVILLTEHFERKLEPGPGLYLLDEEGGCCDLVDKAGRQDESNDPYLVLLHGTFSSTKASFGALFREPERELATPEGQRLLKHYGARILGLEHRTLSVSPIQNALELVEHLPRRARVHLLSHSRGGLIGELLTTAQLAEENLAPFRTQQRDAEADALLALAAKLREKDLRIERFVRAACPARGTILVSERLDRYLSVILNLIGLIPATQSTLLYPFAKAVILSLIKQRANPQDLPGLEAMMPGSPLIQLLNLTGTKTDTDLAVVAGDAEGGGILRRLGLLATDLFYGQSHDFVVHSTSMFKGVERTQGVYYSFEKGPRINHFNYFVNQQSRQRICEWLTRRLDEPLHGFQKLEGEPIPELVRSAFRTKQTDAPVVFIIPDLMATQLEQDGQRLWLDPDTLVKGGLTALALNGAAHNVQVGDLMAIAYQPLLNYLATRFEVHPFPYDWRQSLIATADQLAAALSTELHSHERPVYLLAHGSGGLAARAMIARHHELWRRLVVRNGRLLMVGTPQQGTHVALQLLSGQGQAIETLALLHPTRIDGATPDSAAVAAIARTWPGVIELLPNGAAAKLSDDWFKARHMRKGARQSFIETAKQRDALLHAPDEPTADLAHGFDPAHMCIVAGTGLWTAHSAEEDKDSLKLQGDNAGDGIVSLKSAYLAGVPTWYINAAHGELLRQITALPAFVELLEQGVTNLLAHSTERGMREKTAAAPSPPLLYPIAAEIIGAVLGYSVDQAVGKESVEFSVAVVHGNIAHANHPVAVGHYEGDMIVGVEALLDRLLAHRLSVRNAMNIYPGSVGTVEFVRGPNLKFPGVLVIGLGEIGTITPDVVTKGITEALLRLAMYVAERPSLPEDIGRWRSAAFSSMLIGTSGGNALSVEDSIGAIVKGALQANRVLRQHKLWDQVRIDAVEFIELYEDKAIEAAHAIRHLQENRYWTDEMIETLNIAPYLRTIEGALHGRRVYRYEEAWWRRLQITALSAKDDPALAGGLKFVALTNRARAEETLQPTQRKLIDQLVERAVHESVYLPDLPATLFELLVPHNLKAAATEVVNLQLILDRHAAQYPWEILATRNREGKVQPLAKDIGILRQLATPSSRNRVEAPRGNHALVIGDPDLSGETAFVQLEGAKREAEAIAGLLKGLNYDVNESTSIREKALEIVHKLFAHEYRILHIAGHGVHDPLFLQKSGVVIGQGMFLTAAEIAQLRYVPELVFLNCCHLAKVDVISAANGAPPPLPAWNELAATIAEQLITAGVRAVVAAGWAVNDQAAVTFATEFYRQMLEYGRPFGEAVHQARAKTWQEHDKTNTWGAYQCYGDPGFSLAAYVPNTVQVLEPNVAPTEVIQQLIDLQAEVAQQVELEQANFPEIRSQSRQHLRELEQSIPPEWRSGLLLYHLGGAYGELGDFGTAIRCYREALAQESAQGDHSDVPLRLIEQLGNLEVRYARQLMLDKTTDKVAGIPDKPEELLHRGTTRLQSLLENARTPERYALVAAAFKRRAEVETDSDKRQKLLKQVLENYRNAHDLNQQQGRLNPYHTLNWLTYEWLLASDTNQRAEWLEWITKCEQAAAEREKQQPGFWNRIQAVDAALLRALIDGELTKKEQAAVICDRYAENFKMQATVRMRSTVIEHLTFLATVLAQKGEHGAKLADALHTMQSALERVATVV